MRRENLIWNKKVFSILIILFFSLADISLSADLIKKQKIEMTELENNQFSLIQNNTHDENSILIRLAHTNFDPLQSLPIPKTGIHSIQSYKMGEPGYFIIQFDGPVKACWKDELTGLGVEIFNYVPDYAFIIRMDPQQQQKVQSLNHVRWLGIYQPSYRISQSVIDKINIKDKAPASQPTGDADNNDNETLLRIIVFPGENLSRIESAINGHQAVILDKVTTSWKTSLKIKIPNSNLAALAEISGIKWIEPQPKWLLYNNISTDIMAVRNPRDTHGLYGSGQTVGICDTGIDQGVTTPANLHDDFEDGSGSSRITQIFDVAGDSAPSDVNSGHGTHVAGSVLGNGKMSGSNPATNLFPSTSFTGMAPKANLVFQASENNSSGGLVLPTDLNGLFSQSNSAGADLHTNSWGASAAAGYTAYSQDVDEYIWNNKDFLILFSAGNEGVDMDADGVIDLYSLGAPATAKNCLTVGATENNRPNGAGLDRTWYEAWPSDFPVDPIASDHVSDNISGVAAFSSRGPVLDGRYKPDILGPGTNILSTKSSLISGSGWGAYNSYYMYMGGTSMSTPLAAGATALMREYLISKGESNPSAALIKATLLNSAEDISPGQYGTGATQEIPNSPVPNNVEGWGRLNLENGVYPVDPFAIEYHDVQNSLNTGEFDEYSVDIVSSASPLKVNLVWIDYPGDPSVNGGLVNDLDLQVTTPSSAILYPDNASQKTAITSKNYNDGTPEVGYNANKLAVRFTPPSYPAYIDSITFFFENTTNSQSDVSVIIYDDDAAGLPGGTVLFSKTLTYIPTGWVTIGIPGLVIGSGDFFISIEKNDTSQRLWQDNTGVGRSYYNTGTGWKLDSGYTTYITANLRSADYSTSFDRVNNVLGVTLNNPPLGTYTIKVSGYNVPYGPQPYALVVSGNIFSGCSGDVVQLENITFKSGITYECQAATSITVGSGVVMESGANVTLRAPLITVPPDFQGKPNLTLTTDLL